MMPKCSEMMCLPLWKTWKPVVRHLNVAVIFSFILKAVTSVSLKTCLNHRAENVLIVNLLGH